MRMKPVKAWAVVRADGSMRTTHQTRSLADVACYYGYRVARVEIREVTKRKAKR
jgi:hypothetical protein